MNKFSKFISKQILLIFYIIAIGTGLIATVIILADTVGQASTMNDLSSRSEITNFDQSIIDRLKHLNYSENINTAPAGTTEGRANPFSE